MASFLGIGAAAGFVSALLFVVIDRAELSALAMLLYFLSPLPILIVAMAWNHRAGLVAAIVSTILVLLVSENQSIELAIQFAVGVALPAWWFAYLLLLARTTDTTTEWYPMGRLLGWVACVSAATTVVNALLISLSYDEFVASFKRAAPLLETLNPNAFQGLSPDAKTQSLDQFADLFAIVAPPVATAADAAISVFLIWLAARIVLKSGRFPRPWPDLAWTTLPMGALGLLLAGIAAGIALPGFLGLAGRALAGAMTMAYCLQGLGVIHVVTKGIGGRVGILAAAYVVFFLLPGWPQLLYAVIGIIDPFLGLRAKRAGRSGPPAARPGST
jgi:riboflavin transporter FmnP